MKTHYKNDKKFYSPYRLQFLMKESTNSISVLSLVSYVRKISEEDTPAKQVYLLKTINSRTSNGMNTVGTMKICSRQW